LEFQKNDTVLRWDGVTLKDTHAHDTMTEAKISPDDRAAQVTPGFQAKAIQKLSGLIQRISAGQDPQLYEDPMQYMEKMKTDALYLRGVLTVRSYPDEMIVFNMILLDKRLAFCETFINNRVVRDSAVEV